MIDDHLPGLLDHHVRHLRESGLTDATIKAAGITSETSPEKLAAILGMRKPTKALAPAIVFPFVDANGNNGYYRVRPDTPRTLKGKPVKYESPRGQPNRPYIPPGVAQVLTDTTAELVITEGEKKALAATQAGFSCVGLVGVFGWKEKDSERLLPELERVKWHHRKVFIIFDSDLERKPDVQLAERRLAKHLTDRGAVVRCVRLPDGPADNDGAPTKMGADDFLVAHGAVEFRKALDSAIDPEPLTGAESKLKASELDPAGEAATMLGVDAVDGLPVLRYWRGTWLRWKDGSYGEIVPAEIRARMVRFLNQHYWKLSQRITGDALDQLKAQAMLWGSIEAPAWIDGDTSWPADEVLATKNALVHLPTLVDGGDCIIASTPRYFTTAALDYSFAADAPRPERWLAFLDELWADDADAVATLQEWFGYCLTLNTSLQKMLVLIGPRRSGKGTIARVLRKLIGTANVAGPALAAFAQQFGLWALVGKPLAIIHDARLGGRSDQAVIVERLLSITGEDALTIDRKMIEPWTGKLPTRLMMLTNELPRLQDSSGALVGRMILVRMSESFFGREDSALTDRLLAELPGILLWSIEGWRGSVSAADSSSPIPPPSCYPTWPIWPARSAPSSAIDVLSRPGTGWPSRICIQLGGVGAIYTAARNPALNSPLAAICWRRSPRCTMSPPRWRGSIPRLRRHRAGLGPRWSAYLRVAGHTRKTHKEKPMINEKTTVQRSPEARGPLRTTWPPAWISTNGGSNAKTLQNVPECNDIRRPEAAMGPLGQDGDGSHGSGPDDAALPEVRDADGCPFDADTEPVGDWDWWAQMEPADIAYAREPLRIKPYCPWCFRRDGHTAECETQSDEWSMPLPWGRHKGTLVRHAPREYLEWMCSRDIPGDLKQEIAPVLGADPPVESGVE